MILIQKFQKGRPIIDRSLMDSPSNPSETVNQSKQEDPSKKAARQKAKDENERLAYIEQEKQKETNKEKVRVRIQAQHELDLKRLKAGESFMPEQVPNPLWSENIAVKKDIKRAEYRKKIEEGTNEMMLNVALGMIPIGELARGVKYLGNTATKEAGFLANRWGNIAEDVINASKESGVLSNAYKINPFAFKSNPEAYYRGIGRSGLDDAMESGVLRPGNKKGSAGYGEDVYTTKNFNSAKGNYSKDQPYGEGNAFSETDDWRMVQPKDSKSYIAEIPESSFTNKIRANNSVDPENIFLNRGHISTDNVKFYKEDWLKGYKEIPNLSKKLIPKSSIKKEIDFEKYKNFDDILKKAESNTRQEIIKKNLPVENKLLDAGEDLLKIPQDSYHKTTAKQYVQLMKEFSGLSDKEISKMSESKLKPIAKQIFDEIKQEAIDNYKRDIAVPVKAVETMRDMPLNKKGGLIYKIK